MHHIMDLLAPKGVRLVNLINEKLISNSIAKTTSMNFVSSYILTYQETNSTNDGTQNADDKIHSMITQVKQGEAAPPSYQSRFTQQ